MAKGGLARELATLTEQRQRKVKPTSGRACLYMRVHYKSTRTASTSMMFKSSPPSLTVATSRSSCCTWITPCKDSAFPPAEHILVPLLARELRKCDALRPELLLFDSSPLLSGARRVLDRLHADRNADNLFANSTAGEGHRGCNKQQTAGASAGSQQQQQQRGSSTPAAGAATAAEDSKTGKKNKGRGKDGGKQRQQQRRQGSEPTAAAQAKGEEQSCVWLGCRPHAATCGGRELLACTGPA